MIKISNKKEKCLVDLSGELTIYHAEALKNGLTPALTEPRPVEINLRGVTDLDTAGVQMLMLVKRERQRQGLDTSLVKHSKAVLDAFELFNLVPYFNDPVILARKKGDAHGS